MLSIGSRPPGGKAPDGGNAGPGPGAAGLLGEWFLGHQASFLNFVRF